MRRVNSIGAALDATAPQHVSTMRKVNSVGFALDATVPVPNRKPDRKGLATSALSSLEQKSVQNQAPLETHLASVCPSHDLRALLLALASSFQDVAHRLSFGLRMPSALDASVDKIPTRLDAAGDVGRLDVAVGHFLVEALQRLGVQCTVALETHEGVIGCPGAGGEEAYAVVLDPLDGVNNADAGVSVGTIFGIYRLDESARLAEPHLQQVLRHVAHGVRPVARRAHPARPSGRHRPLLLACSWLSRPWVRG
jgi:hypothetical protein